VFSNNGSYNGGIRIGQPFLQLPDPDGDTYEFNTQVNIHNNAITQNGGLGGAGGGLSITTGTDDYNVSSNFVCGNFTTGDGGGIGHLGLSDGGVIANNRIVLNQSFNQGVTVSGGGVFIGGERVVPEAGELDNPNTLGHGSGSVTLDNNLIQSNHAGAGHGGGIRTQFVNGLDVLNSIGPGNNAKPNPAKWYTVTLTNNKIVNNVTGWSGGGVSLKDTARAIIDSNVIARNDSTATVGGLITGGNLSTKQPAGISTETHSTGLNDLVTLVGTGEPDFSEPVMTGNTLFENRSFHYAVISEVAQLIPNLSQGYVGDCPGGAEFWDLDPLLGGALGGPTASDPGFDKPFCNGGRKLRTVDPGPYFPLPALDEGGNAWIDVRYGPLTGTWLPGTGPWSYEVTP
jgi:hypothetical protein